MLVPCPHRSPLLMHVSMVLTGQVLEVYRLPNPSDATMGINLDFTGAVKPVKSPTKAGVRFGRMTGGELSRAMEQFRQVVGGEDGDSSADIHTFICGSGGFRSMAKEECARKGYKYHCEVFG